jgi:DNA-binding MarR family transcriptional regulator
VSTQIPDSAPHSGQPSILMAGEIARRMGIDRTTMVALIDDLQERGLVRRRQDPDDRRKNIVELTEAGQDITRLATRARDRAEQTFLSPLSADEAEQFKKTLRALLYDSPASPG